MDRAIRPDPAAACDLRQLDYGEHLLVWSFRAIVAGRWDCEAIRREHRQACGAAAEPARQALRAFALEIERSARHPITLGQPGLLGVTRDEQRILAAYAAAQSDDRPRFEAHMSRLIGRAADPVFYALACLTARALADRGHRLGAATRAPLRAPPSGRDAAPPAAPVPLEPTMSRHDPRPIAPSTSAPGPTLAPAERLLIASLLAWAQARRQGLPPQRALGALLAARASPRAAALFAAWAQAIEADSLRPLQAECPHCGGAGPDVQRLVAACGVAPVDLGLGERLIAPLVRDPAMVMILARSLNAALAASGWPLPARLGPPPEGSAGEPPQTLH